MHTFRLLLLVLVNIHCHCVTLFCFFSSLSKQSFQCSKCKRKWPSSRVMVVFHMKLWKRQRKGVVKVRRTCQDCKKCTAAPMEKPTFSPDNLDILLEKLMGKIRVKCYHERTDEDNRPFRTDPVQSPHEPAHCEGCILGICTKNAPGRANRF